MTIDALDSDILGLPVLTSAALMEGGYDDQVE